MMSSEEIMNHFYTYVSSVNNNILRLSEENLKLTSDSVKDNQEKQALVEENKQLVSALSQEHDERMKLEEENKRLKKQLEREIENNCFSCNKNEMELKMYTESYVKTCKQYDLLKNEKNKVVEELNNLKKTVELDKSCIVELEKKNAELNIKYHDLRSKHDTFLYNIIDKITSPKDKLRSLNYNDRDLVREARSKCISILYFWNLYREDTGHSAYDNN